MDFDAIFLLALKLGLVVGLVLLNGFFVAAEFALVKVRDTQLETMVQKGNRRAILARRVVKNLDASLSATQLGITLASLGLGWFAEPVFASILGPGLHWIGIESPKLHHSISFAIGFSVITFLHIVVGELAPKSLAIQKPVPTSLWVSYPLYWFFRCSYPFIWGLNHTSNWLLRRCGLEPVSESELVHSEEELRLLISATQEHHGTSELGQDIIMNALDLRNRIARDVMQPRNEIEVFDTEAPIEECVKLAESTRFSRFPLCDDGDLDKTLGVVHYKDLFAARRKAKTGADLKKYCRQLIYIPETARLETLLGLFLKRKLHFAIVVDEYGVTIGLVTLENILEELVGQIQDEFDHEQPLFTEIDETTWEIQGSFPLHDLSELIDQDIVEEGITTTSGWITHKLGGFPKVGDVVSVNDDYELKVETLDGLLVSTLTLMKKQNL